MTVNDLRVLALDPGETTGLCGWDGSAARQTEEPCWDAVRTAEIALRVQDLEALVVEAYIVTAQTLRKTRQHWSLESIGALRYLARKADVPFVLQTAADAKRFGTDAKLRAAGLWVPGQEHARDAGRHLLLYLANVGRLGEILPEVGAR